MAHVDLLLLNEERTKKETQRQKDNLGTRTAQRTSKG
jgi:hypothetical protein